MIRKFLAISLSVIYLTITIGFPISIHHCHGQDEVSIAITGEADCNCAAASHKMENCCSIELDELSHCQTDHHESGCCTHETKVVHFDLQQQLAQKEEFKLQIVEIDLFDSQLLFDSDSEDLVNNSNMEFLSNPPPKTIPLQILNQEFIFYG